jgi:tetraacyldisaccharide-1-P 4'-kinase
LVESGVQPAEWMRFPDHASYEGSQLRYLRQWARQLCPELPIACTLKDLVKLRAVDWEHVGAPPRATEAECGPPQTPARIRALHTEIEIVSGQDEWETQIRNAIRQS